MSRIGRMIVGLLTAVACVIVPTGAASAAGAEEDVVACAIDWDGWSNTGGFTAGITIHNTGTVTLYGWTLLFPLEEGAVIVNMWNAEPLTRSGLIAARDLGYNAKVPRGGSETLGFEATGPLTRVPSPFKVNGVECTVNE